MNSPVASQADSIAPPDLIRLSAVMPCLNEERTVGVCIEKAFEAFRSMGIVGEVIVADNGSTDRSVELASAQIGRAHV